MFSASNLHVGEGKEGRRRKAIIHEGTRVGVHPPTGAVRSSVSERSTNQLECEGTGTAVPSGRDREGAGWSMVPGASTSVVEEVVVAPFAGGLLEVVVVDEEEEEEVVVVVGLTDEMRAGIESA